MKYPTDLVTSCVDSPLGPIRLAASAQGLVGAWFQGQGDAALASQWQAASAHPLLRQASDQITQYFANQRHHFDLPLDLSAGTAFQQSVWRALLAIGYGQTVSYGAISQAIGKPNAVRAVGGAIGKNPLSIVVPCHRVIGANGALTGYSGGLDRKVALLQLESTA